MSDPRSLDDRLADAVPGLRCPTCGGEVFPCPSGNVLEFYCPHGHGIGLQEIAGRETESARFALGVALEGWELTVGRLERSAAEARARGLQPMAEIFERQIAALKSRIRCVREVFPRHRPAARPW